MQHPFCASVLISNLSDPEMKPLSFVFLLDWKKKSSLTTPNMVNNTIISIFVGFTDHGFEAARDYTSGKHA